MAIVAGLTFSRTGFVGVCGKRPPQFLHCVFLCVCCGLSLFGYLLGNNPVVFSMALVGLANSQRLELIHGVLNLLGLLFRKLVVTGLSQELNEDKSVSECFPPQFRGLTPLMSCARISLSIFSKLQRLA